MYKITHFPKLLEPENQKKFELSWERLAKTLTHPRPYREKKKRELWSPAIFQGKRSKENAIETSLLVFDIDQGGETIGKAMEGLQGFQYILHTTASHTKEAHKYRVILPIFNPIPASLWPYYYTVALDWWNEKIGVEADPSCKDISRAYFLAYDGDDYQAIIQPGDWLDFTALAEMEREHQEAQADQERIQKELDLKQRENYYNNRQKAHASHTDWYKYLYNLFNTSLQEREQLATRIGGTIRDGKVVGFNCPYCGRNDATFYYISPIPWSSGFCKHMNTCKDKGQLTTFSLYWLASSNNLI